MIVDLGGAPEVVMIPLSQWRVLLCVLYACYAITTGFMVWRICDAVCQSKMVAKLLQLCHIKS
jgi:hypothetical protein